MWVQFLLKFFSQNFLKCLIEENVLINNSIFTKTKATINSSFIIVSLEYCTFEVVWGVLFQVTDWH